MNALDKEVRLYGAGGHSEVLQETLLFKGISIKEIYDDFIDDSQKQYPNNLIKKSDLGNSSIPQGPPFIIAIGDNLTRSKIRKSLKNCQFTSVSHPQSTVSPSAQIGEGTVIFAGVIVQANTQIGNHVIINTGASVDHGNKIQDFVHISPKVTLSGNVTVGEGTHIGSAAVVIPDVKIGKWCTIGAGAVIIKDVPDYCTVVGNPGRIIKTNGLPVTHDKELNQNSEVNNSQLELKIQELNDDCSIQEYKLWHQRYWKNPFHSFAYFSHHKEIKSDILIIQMFQGEELLAQMPVIKRRINIEINGQTYYDVTSPYGYGGPVFKEPQNFLLVNSFWKLLEAWYKKENIISEFIRFNLDGNHNGYTGNLVPTLQNVKGKILTNPQDHWEQFKPKVRNNYRKAQSHGIVFDIFKGHEIGKQEILKFYEIYTGTMDRNHASKEYFFPVEYFYELIFSQPDQIALAFSSIGNEPVSTELILIDNKTIYAYLGGTDRNHFDKRPNDFLRVEIINWAVQQKYKWYILGGGRSDGDGLYKSKKYLFPKDTDCIFYTGRKIINANIYNQLTESRFGKTMSDENDRNGYFPAYRKPEDSTSQVYVKE